MRIIVGQVPIAAPLVNVLAYVIKAESVRLTLGDRLGPILPKISVVGTRLRRLIAPGKQLSFEPTARSPFPFRFCRESIVASRSRKKPFAITRRFKPGNRNHRLPWIAEIRITPEGRRHGAGCGEKEFILTASNLA